MNKTEQKSVVSLSIIMALRMLGLFMVLPVFAVYASHLSGATPLLIGLAMGIYGLTQALLQIPFGALSDYIGRKKVITIGLSLFIFGSIIAALSHSIWGVLAGRALQGMGAIGSTIIALISDLTREDQRTKAMAITGMTIGFSFSLAMLLGPLLAAWMQINGLFWLAALFSVIGILLLFTLVPNPSQQSIPEPISWTQLHLLIKNPGLFRLNVGIFILHAIFTASFIVIPISLQALLPLQGSQQWLIYLPVLAAAFLLSVPFIWIAEKKRLMKVFFIGGILVLGLSEFLFWFSANKRLLSLLSLLLFLAAFSLLEAFLPSLVSRIAPPARKGIALGIYSFSQFFGIFIGGLVGGWLYGAVGLMQIHLFCAILSIIWLALAFSMKNPQYSITTLPVHV